MSSSTPGPSGAGDVASSMTAPSRAAPDSQAAGPENALFDAARDGDETCRWRFSALIGVLKNPKVFT